MPTLMPVLFTGHGNPLHGLADNEFTQSWQRLAEQIPTPETVLAISAHTLTDGTAISTNPAPSTIHDFYNFPQALYDIQYPCPGNPALAHDIIDRLSGATSIRPDEKMGMDHGTWIVLSKIFPKANIPVVTLSIADQQTPLFHFDLGHQLRFLRQQGVLILCSGNIVHNIGKAMAEMGGPIDWATDFDFKVAECLIERQFESLLDFETWGKLSTDAHPTTEHLLPLFYLLGLHQSGDQFTFSKFSEVTLETAFMRSVLMSEL